MFHPESVTTRELPTVQQCSAFRDERCQEEAQRGQEGGGVPFWAHTGWGGRGGFTYRLWAIAGHIGDSDLVEPLRVLQRAVCHDGLARTSEAREAPQTAQSNSGREKMGLAVP